MNLKRLDVFECTGREELIREIRLNTGTKKSIGIFGDAGVGR